MDMSKIAAIEAQNLTVEYKTERKGKKIAVSGLSFSVGQGEIVGFIGPNGAGKTSTIKSLLDFTPVKSGKCFINGVPTSDPKSRALVGYMPEISYYPKYLTLYEFLDACAQVSGVPGKKRKGAVAYTEKAKQRGYKLFLAPINYFLFRSPNIRLP
jgi:ABC-2 type transport system ATP-binding protein